MSDNGPESFRLLFVCSGNTCRSPLARALFERELAVLGWRVDVRSGGVSAAAGEPASRGSLEAARRHGLDLSEHESRPVDDELVRWADLILVMSPGHLLSLAEMGAAGKAALIDAFARGEEGSERVATGGIPDPFGGDERDYEYTFRTLEDLVPEVLQRLQPIFAP